MSKLLVVELTSSPEDWEGLAEQGTDVVGVHYMCVLMCMYVCTYTRVCACV